MNIPEWKDIAILRDVAASRCDRLNYVLRKSCRVAPNYLLHRTARKRASGEQKRWAAQR